MLKNLVDENIVAELDAIMLRVKEIAPKIYGKTPKACINTFGCQQNVSDSEKIKGMLVRMGYELTENQEEADFILFNTCAVREHAEERVFGNIGTTKQIKRERKETIVAVCGCMAQQEHICERIRKSYPYVDIAFGTHVTHRLPEFIYKRLTGSGRIFEISNTNNEIIEGLPLSRDGKLKGWLPIMYGCDNFCTYCIVPYVRGRERSRASAEILAEAKQMIEAGFKEIMLLGQNVNSYGKGLDEDINFSKLLRKINETPGDFRIRFMTSHPKDCTKELIDTVAECEKIETHLHLPFQSGSNRILKQMNRRYTKEDYLELINYAKKKIPDVTFTSDVIVGFPGETYEDILETLDLVKQVEFMSLFTFIYSPRKGTPAAEMPDPISRKEKGVWFSELLEVQEQISRKRNASLVGKEVTLLCDEVAGEGLLSGKALNATEVLFQGDASLVGKTVKVKIEKFTNVLEGKIIEE